MTQSSSTVSTEAAKPSSTSQPPVPVIQRAPDHGGGDASAFGRRVKNAVGGGSPQTPPTSFASLLGHAYSSPSAQAGVFQQLHRGYGNHYVGRVIQRKC